MKKIMILLIVVFSLALTAGLASATDVSGSGVIGTGTGSLSLATSSNVQISYVGEEQAYGSAGQHKAGNRAYATWATTPGIYWKDKTAGEFLTTGIAASADTSSWTAQ